MLRILIIQAIILNSPVIFATPLESLVNLFLCFSFDVWTPKQGFNFDNCVMS